MEEQEFDFIIYLDKNIYPDMPDTFKEEYPKKGKVDKYYVDQAPRYSQVYDRQISSFFTPFWYKQT